MPTPSKGPRMGGSPAHERLMLANLATSLFEHGRITTTEAKAKRLRPYAEHLITFGKRGDLHARRQVLKRLNRKDVVHTLFAEIGPRFADRQGGYTRILKLGNRKGDNAPMAIIELVEAQTVRQQAVGEAERARGTRTAPRKAPTGATRESAEQLKDVSPTAAAVAAESAAGSAAQEQPAPDEVPVTTVGEEQAAASADSPDSPDSADSPDVPDTVVADPDPAAVAELQAAQAEASAAQEQAAQAEAELEAARAQLAEAEAASRPTVRLRTRRGLEVAPARPDEPAPCDPGGGLARVRDAHREPAPGTLRVRLDLAYDGTGFRGWAAQPGGRTVQGELEAALGTLLRADPPRLTVAGRTDAGVHARGQVAHVDLPQERAADPLLLRRLNGLLPPDVRVRRTALAADGFDARFSALSRTYRYRVADGPEALDPLRRDVLAVPRPLDVTALQASCAPMLGEHDFAAFCRRREGASTVRALLELAWERLDGLLVLTIRADAFCHSMVRSVVGAMLAVGDGRREPDWPASLLSRRERATDVAVAAAHGLVLEHVAYPPDGELRARQGVTRGGLRTLG